MLRQLRSQISPVYVLTGFGSLALAAYFDNIRGPLLPAMAQDLNLGFTASAWFFAVGYAGATAATFGLNPALNAVSERAVMLAVCAGGLACALLAQAVGSFPVLMILAGLVGATVSVFGTMSNVLVLEGTPPPLQGRALSSLHAVYGVGSMAATAVAAFALRRGWHWSWLYELALPFLALFLGLAVRRMGALPPRGVRTVQSHRLSPLQAFVAVLFAVYVGGEVTTATWLVTYLVRERGVDAPDAALHLTGYFLALTAARLACVAFVRPERERGVLVVALAVPIAAYAVGRLTPLHEAFALMGLFGAFYPVFLARISRAFPDKWRTVTIWSIIGMNVTMAGGNLAIGRIADAAGMSPAFLVPPALLLTALAMLGLYLRWEPRPRQNN
jgi:fucose permease